MWVELGNKNAIEGYRDANSDDPELVRFRPVEGGGERITTIQFPDDTPLAEAFATAVAIGPNHFEADDGPHGHALPHWVESDSPGLKSLLSEHYGLTKATQQRRPKTWGKEFGLHENEDLLSAKLYAAQGDAEEDSQ